MTRKQRVTSGAIISSFCFGGVGLWLLSQAAVAGPLKATLLYLCAVACIAAAFRLPIAAALERWRG